ncbi:MAG: AsmA family protein, partial [Chlorobi bacterium]|nr:AsmA family protein [Chlorobiota bacterium]
MIFNKKKNIAKPKRSVPRKILNFFIGVFGVVVFLLIVAVGFMQTNTFRGWLKEKITTTVNDEINGNLSIGSVEGTILTSLFVNDISLTTGGDTLATVSKFGLKINPVELLLGRIYVRTLLLNSPKISLLQDKNGIWLTERLAKETEEIIEEKADSLKTEGESSFPFKIFINDISINNLSFVKKTFENRGTHKKYKIINTDDLEIDSMYFAAKVAADLNNNSFQLLIERLSGKTNTKSFRLRNLSGAFIIKPGFAQVGKLNVVTDSSNISISAQLDGINLFAPLDLKEFKNFPVKVSASAQPFNFDDLTSFLSATNILKGNVFFNLEANGKFGDFNINKLSAKINE